MKKALNKCKNTSFIKEIAVIFLISYHMHFCVVVALVSFCCILILFVVTQGKKNCTNEKIISEHVGTNTN